MEEIKNTINTVLDVLDDENTKKMKMLWQEVHKRFLIEKNNIEDETKVDVDEVAALDVL